MGSSTTRKMRFPIVSLGMMTLFCALLLLRQALRGVPFEIATVLQTFEDTSKRVIPGQLGNITESADREEAKEISDRRRVFLRYESSSWEQGWIKAITENETRNPMAIKNLINNRIRNESTLVRRYLNTTCTRFPIGESALSPWCIIDDTYRPIFFNRQTGLAQQRPAQGVQFGPIQPLIIHDKDAENFSRMIYHDETTQEEYHEYIEPLVAYLRHPLTCTESVYEFGAHFSPAAPRRRPGCFGWLRTSRTHFVYPSVNTRLHKSARKMYFDARASDWWGGRGGPSLAFFFDAWLRHGIQFDEIFAYEAETTPEAFYQEVPEEHRNMVHYFQGYVRSKANDTSMPDRPFIPQVIQEKANENDYVLFKLDIDSPGVEEGHIEFLMDPANKQVLNLIDEFFYEFHLEGATTLASWYKNFYYFRQQGVRAHSWI